MTRRRILIAAIALLAVAGAVGAVVIHRMTTGKLDHGTVFTASSGDLAVKPGELFSVEVSAHRVTGQIWTVADPAPDPAAVQTVGDEYVKNFGLKDLVGATGSAGSGGRYYFVFRAGPNPGRTTLTLHDPHHAGGGDQDERHYTVDVR
ncbi:protease inhibitor I42 family protein [Streptomyces sp. NRRL S-350]|uniref:protease inhibitor I42 family protein n=1 Tax=Streptomyces sp. NRRL S-350 TaxID=1463902 RepID=UPI0004C09FC4|nr:protease inhibitor I42 family protein [Streptomyces sp. NRRL S-350]